MTSQVILVLGGPGCGKGTVCSYLQQKYGFCHISVGELFRKEMGDNSKVGEIIKHSISISKIVDPTITIDILKKELEQDKYKDNIVLVDGYPRDLDNYEAWIQYLNEKTVHEKYLVYLECSDENMLERTSYRSKQEGNRFDDELDVVKRRIQVFKDETMKIVNLYKQNNCCVEIDVNKSKDELFLLLDKLKL